MTIEQAIKSLENIIEYWDCRPTEQKAAELALTALQEKQERERGCRHCLKSRFIHYSYSAENFVEEVFIKNGCQMTITNCAVLGGTFRAGEDVYFKINFCPICGRKLGENNG